MSPLPKLNCWEAMECGREPGGAKAGTTGVCPASTAEHYHGINNGHNAGRFCWVVAGTLCGGEVQGTFAQKAITCMRCEFYVQLVQEEREALVLSPAQ